MKETNGVGCDIILSCVKRELKNVRFNLREGNVDYKYCFFVIQVNKMF